MLRFSFHCLTHVAVRTASRGSYVKPTHRCVTLRWWMRHTPCGRHWNAKPEHSYTRTAINSRPSFLRTCPRRLHVNTQRMLWLSSSTFDILAYVANQIKCNRSIIICKDIVTKSWNAIKYKKVMVLQKNWNSSGVGSTTRRRQQRRIGIERYSPTVWSSEPLT